MLWPAAGSAGVEAANGATTASSTCGGGSSGGACFSPGTPTPDQQHVTALKRKTEAEIQAGQLPNDQNTARHILGLPSTTFHHVSAKDAGSAAVQPMSSGYSGGWYWVSMNKWVEADGGCTSYSSCGGGSCYGTANGYTNPRTSEPAAYYYNMCGPGSSEAIISNWNSNPSTYSGYYYYGYVASQGLHWLGYMFTLANEEEGSCSNYTTCTSTEASIINHEIGSSYYQVDTCAGANATCSTNAYTEWKSDTNTDIASVGVPLVAEVETCNTSGGSCQAGWPYRADHFQAMSQYNPGAGQIEYGETGNAADTCYFGYGSGAPGAFTGSWTDPTNGYTFNDSSGWNYATSYYQWTRSLDLVW